MVHAQRSTLLPGALSSGCVKSTAWVVAAAPGLIVRAEDGAVVEDLDGDGNEQTGWNILYMHISDMAIEAGDWVETSDYIRPSIL